MPIIPTALPGFLDQMPDFPSEISRQQLPAQYGLIYLLKLGQGKKQRQKTKSDRSIFQLAPQPFNASPDNERMVKSQAVTVLQFGLANNCVAFPAFIATDLSPKLFWPIQD